MNNLYVYYKLPAAATAAALEPAHGVLDAGRAWCARAALLARPAPDAAGAATWMETYEDVSDLEALEAALAAAAVRTGLDRFLLGPRRAEAFAELPAAARA